MFTLSSNLRHSLARTCCTQYRRHFSSLLQITASIIQGSAIRLSSYVLCASDLKLATSGNEMVKFADDSYIIIIPSSNVESRRRDVKHAEQFAVNNNLKVNVSKYVEVVFFDTRSRNHTVEITPPY